MEESYTPPPLRAPTACVACNKRKVRCIFEGNSRECRSCLRHRWPCFQRQGKRRGRPGRSRSKGHGEHPQTPAPDAQSTPDCDSYRLDNNGPSQETSPPATMWSGNSAPSLAAQEARQPSRGNRSEHSANPYTSVPRSCGFMERNDYFRDTDTESIARDHGTILPMGPAENPTEDDVQLLRLQRAFDMPPRAIRESLIDIFMERCAPWMPIVERSWLEENGTNQPSLLLLQSIFLAASRVTSAPAITAYASSHEFYRRAKALFWSGWEKNPLTVVASVCILHWYNPECPERVSTNTSGFWRYVGVGLAHQIGLHKEPSGKEGRNLRRRLWWSLFARDCLISAGQGRPLAVNMCDSEVKLPCAEDFRDSSSRPDLFIAYVEICSILGHLTQCCRRDSLTRRTRQSVSKSLQRWAHCLPPCLRLSQDIPNPQEVPCQVKKVPTAYNFEARQLHIPYFICLIILCRAPSAQHAPSAATILAASHVAAIFEDFLARDEIQFLGSIFTFHLLAAGIGLLSSRKLPLLWDKAERDMRTIYSSLEQLARRWPSAMAPLRVLRSIADEQQNNTVSSIPPPKLPEEHLHFFNTFGPGLSWAWDFFMPHSSSENNKSVSPANLRQFQFWDEPGISGVSPDPKYIDSPAIPDSGHILTTMLDASRGFSGLDMQQSTMDEEFSSLQYEGIGDWLLNDCDFYGDATF